MGDIIDLYEGLQRVDEKVNALVGMLQEKGVIDLKEEAEDDTKKAKVAK